MKRSRQNPVLLRAITEQQDNAIVPGCYSTCLSGLTLPGTSLKVFREPFEECKGDTDAMGRVDEREVEQLWLFEPALKLDMARLKEFRGDFVLAQQALNTVKGYASDWRLFTMWCLKAGRETRPASAETVELYVTYLLQVDHLKVVTAERHVCAILDAHRRAGVTLPRCDGVRAILSGARRQRKERPAAKKPLQVRQLPRISGKFRKTGSARDIRDRALLVLGFAPGLLRA